MKRTNPQSYSLNLICCLNHARRQFDDVVETHDAKLDVVVGYGYLADVTLLVDVKKGVGTW